MLRNSLPRGLKGVLVKKRSISSSDLASSSTSEDVDERKVEEELSVKTGEMRETLEELERSLGESRLLERRVFLGGSELLIENRRLHYVVGKMDAKRKIFEGCRRANPEKGSQARMGEEEGAELRRRCRELETRLQKKEGQLKKWKAEVERTKEELDSLRKEVVDHKTTVRKLYAMYLKQKNKMEDKDFQLKKLMSHLRSCKAALDSCALVYKSRVPEDSRSKCSIHRDQSSTKRLK